MAGGHEARSHWQRLELIQQAALGPQQKLLLVWLWKYAGDDGHAFPRQAQLAADMGLSERQVRRLIASMEGVVAITSDGTRNSYAILWDTLPDSVQDKPRPARKKGGNATSKPDTSVRNDTNGNRTPVSGNKESEPDTHVRYEGGGTGHPRPVLPDTSVRNNRTPTSGSTLYINSIKTPVKLQCGLTGIEFPDELQDERFATAWAQWHQYRRERRLGKWKPVTVQAQLKALAKIGAEPAVATIETSIRQGWQGLFPERQRQGKGQQTTRDRLQGLQQWADGGAP